MRFPKSRSFGRGGCVPHAHRQNASRRSTLLTFLGSLGIAYAPTARADDAVQVPDNIGNFADSINKLEKQAMAAYERRDFKKAVDTLSEIIYQQPNNPYWSELRAQVLVDGRNFSAAVMDYNQAMGQISSDETEARSRLYQGRALALEGDGDWQNALGDYKRAQELAKQAGLELDPYTTHSIGNCYAALGEWQKARNSFNLAARLFDAQPKDASLEQKAAANLDGSIYARPNAALALAQLGDVGGAQKELEDIAAKGGEAAVDANAALTGIYQSGSEMDKAAKTWAKVCQTLKDPTSGNDDNDASLPGCKYMEKGWLMHTRRWPIVAIDLLGKFIDLQE